MKIKTNSLAVAACTTDFDTTAPNAPRTSGYLESVCANYGISIADMITDLKEDELFKEKLTELSIKAFNQYYATDQGYAQASTIMNSVYTIVENSVIMLAEMIIEHKIQNLRNVEFTRSKSKFIDMLISKPVEDIVDKTRLEIDERFDSSNYEYEIIEPIILSSQGFDKLSNISNSQWAKEWIAKLQDAHLNESTAKHLWELFHPVYILRNKDRSQGQIRFVSFSMNTNFDWYDADQIKNDLSTRALANKTILATYPYLESILMALNMNWCPIDRIYDRDSDDIKIKCKPGWDFTRDIHATKIEWRYDAKDGIYNALQTVLSAPFNKNDAMDENTVWTYSVTSISDNAIMINNPVCTELLRLCLPEIVPNEMIETMEHIELYLKGNLQEYGLAVHAKFGSFQVLETIQYYDPSYYTVFGCVLDTDKLVSPDAFSVGITSNDNDLSATTVRDLINANVIFYLSIMYNNQMIVKCDMPHTTVMLTVDKDYDFDNETIDGSVGKYVIKDLDLGDALMKSSAIEYNVAQASTDFLTGVITFNDTNKQVDKSSEDKDIPDNK